MVRSINKGDGMAVNSTRKDEYKSERGGRRDSQKEKRAGRSSGPGPSETGALMNAGKRGLRKWRKRGKSDATQKKKHLADLVAAHHVGQITGKKIVTMKEAFRWPG